jgi:N-acetylglucosamine kinase-like BadF-type ATPase
MIKHPTYVVGVDVGGTKTQAVVMDERGRVLGWGKSGPGNPTRVSLQVMRASLHQAIAEALAASNIPHEAVAATCLGVAGARGYRPWIAETIGQLDVGGEIIVVGDVEIAFAAAIAKPIGVIIIAGTGSSAFGVGSQGETAVAGGRGYLVGDEGSAYDIGRAGIQAALRAFDGRGPDTALLARLVDFYQLADVEQIIPTLYHTPASSNRTRISDFAPVVVQTARAGDAISLKILARAGRELGLTGLAVARKLGLCGQAFELALVGGVFRAGEFVTAPLRETVHAVAPKAHIFANDTLPALGAARLALQEV